MQSYNPSERTIDDLSKDFKNAVIRQNYDLVWVDYKVFNQENTLYCKIIKNKGFNNFEALDSFDLFKNHI